VIHVVHDVITVPAKSLMHVIARAQWYTNIRFGSTSMDSTDQHEICHLSTVHNQSPLCMRIMSIQHTL
jgi:hypothetical protein